MHDDNLGDDDHDGDDHHSPVNVPRHPPLLCAVIIIRSRPEYTPRSAISAFAVLTVRKVAAREASFALVHRAFDRSDTRAAVIDALCELIPEGATLLVRHPPLAFQALRQKIATGDVLPPNDTQLIIRRVRHLKVYPFAVSDRKLIAAGRKMGLEMALQGSPLLKRKRQAPEQAMALWAIYVTAFFRPAEARALIAALQAWRVIEKSRPLPF